MRRIELRITLTAKGYREKTYTIFDHETITLPPEEIRNYLSERYRKVSRRPMYRDKKDGTCQQTGYIYGFRNYDGSHFPVRRFLQQDWVEFMVVEYTAADPKALLREPKQ